MHVVGFPLEFGTVPIQGPDGTGADNWLHIYFDQTSTRWGGIKKQIRDAFYGMSIGGKPPCSGDPWT